jgi:hypothetical protein
VDAHAKLIRYPRTQQLSNSQAVIVPFNVFSGQCQRKRLVYRSRLIAAPSDAVSRLPDRLAKRLAPLIDTIRRMLRSNAEQRKRYAHRYINAYLQRHSNAALRDLGYSNAQIAAIRSGDNPVLSPTKLDILP